MSAPVWFVLSCKGRLSFVQQSLQAILGQVGAACSLVDFDCPDDVGKWAERAFPAEIAARRLLITRVVERPHWNRGVAQNCGAKRAIDAGAEYLALIDADTIIQPGLLDWLYARLNADRFWIAGLRPDGTDDRDVYGFAMVPAGPFAAIGGYDEQFRGWGCEDVDLRLRLHFVAGLQFDEVPLGFLKSLPHGDDLRTRFHVEKNIRVSDAANHLRMYAKLRSTYGLDQATIHRTARRLLCQMIGTRS